ncbi:MAG: hypothetical protein WC110_06475 [Bacteroidales bacterium]|jgi:hypothetical protein
MCNLKPLKPYRAELVRQGKITQEESDEIKDRATGLGILEFALGAGLGFAMGVIITTAIF